MSGRQRCVACGKLFKALPQLPEQSYCSEEACQRERRKLWQRTRRAEDPDYRENQARAQDAWLARNPDYWRIYRERNPQYTQHNRDRQRDRARARRGSSVAKMNESDAASMISSGLYRLTIVAVSRVAKMDASFLVELAPVKEEGDR